MRPLRLALRAFGSFAGEEIVDFRELGERSFFLIHGPTGAGKTTLFDAICFALYGDASGEEREGRRMRSDHADPAAPTGVTLDFRLGREVYRVERRPQQEIPRRRGDGTRLDPPRATLWRLAGGKRGNGNGNGGNGSGGEGTVVASQWSRVGEEIERLLGFRAEQFRQVVMLPQGEFRRLLSATSKERQEILEVLFSTGAYREIEEALRDRSLSLARDARDLAREREILLEQAEAESEAALDAAVRQRTARLESLRRELEARRERECAAANALAAARRLLELHRSEQTARERLARAREEADAAAGALRSAEDELERQRGRAPELAAARERVARLEDLAGRAGDLERLRAAERDVALRLARLESQRAEERAELERARGAIEERRRELASAELAAALLDGRRRQEEEAARALAGRERLDEGEAAVRDARDRLAERESARDAAVESLRTIRAELELAERAWAGGQAAVLAAGLERGSPCPVCGSTEHPRPARSGEPLPTEAGLEALRGAVRDREGAVERVAGEVTAARDDAVRLSAEVAAIAGGLGGDAVSARAAFEERLRAAGEARRGSEQAAERVESLRPEVRRLEGRRGAAETRLGKLDAAVRDQAAARERCRAVVEEREAQLPAEARTVEALERVLGAARGEVEALEREAAGAAGAVRVAAERAARAGAAVTHNETALAELAESIAFAREELRERTSAAGLEGGGDRGPEVGEAELADAADAITAEVGRLESAHAAAKKNLDDGAAEITRLVDQILREGRVLERLREIDGRLRAVDEEHRVTGRLAEVACGQNRLGLTFQRFVLSAFLDDVLVAATARLRVMTRERFLLQRVRERTDARRAGGLDLEVWDGWTGTVRPVATLSGGEGFLASLALALGLADVVQEHAGGIRLETLLVDEGFGSLDSESLDLALRALIDLQRTGRLVGVISHVPELRERVDTRLEVVAGRCGSSTRFVGG